MQPSKCILVPGMFSCRYLTIVTSVFCFPHATCNTVGPNVVLLSATECQPFFRFPNLDFCRFPNIIFFFGSHIFVFFRFPNVAYIIGSRISFLFSVPEYCLFFGSRIFAFFLGSRIFVGFFSIRFCVRLTAVKISRRGEPFGLCNCASMIG